MSAVSSEEDLCARNFYITLDDRQYDLMSLRDTPLLIPVQMDLLQPEGGVLRARCLPWITTLHAGGGEELMLYVMSAWLSEDLLYQESLRHAGPRLSSVSYLTSRRSSPGRRAR